VIDANQARARLAGFPDAAVSGEGSAITVAVPPAHWVALARAAKEELGCTFFSFLSAVDWKDDGLEVIAWVDNLDGGFSVLMKSRLGAGVTSCETIVPVYRGAEWMEREAFDMFGIRFEGHPDLRRILLDQDWVGHPLLKSYAVDTPYPPYR
jgi:NADH-quinone oxidoreductase subunit C